MIMRIEGRERKRVEVAPWTGYVFSAIPEALRLYI